MSPVANNRSIVSSSSKTTLHSSNQVSSPRVKFQAQESSFKPKSQVFAFLDLRKNYGNKSDRARDLFYALWIPDLFMECIKAHGNWSLFCPHVCTTVTEKSSRSCTNATNERARSIKPCLHINCGLPFWTVRLKPEYPTCSIRMPAMPSPTSHTLASFSARTCARKLSSTPHRTKLLFAIWLAFHSPNSWTSSGKTAKSLTLSSCGK